MRQDIVDHLHRAEKNPIHQRRWSACLIAVGLFFIPSLHAHVLFMDYSFPSVEQQERFSEIAGELRCMVCANQSLADSNAPLASAMRAELYEAVLLGSDKEEIIRTFQARYGDWVSYRPAFSWKTSFLWLAPWIMGLAILSRLLRSWRVLLGMGRSDRSRGA